MAYVAGREGEGGVREGEDEAERVSVNETERDIKIESAGKRK